MFVQAVLGVLVVAGGKPGTFSNFDQDATKYAVFSILDSSASSTTVAVPGKVEKSNAGNAVMNMTMPWESNVNNGYSSVLYDPDDSTGLGVYRAFYSAGDPAFVAPDCPPNECGSGTATLMANSSDGVHWEKPMLDLFPWNASSACCIACPGGKCPCPACEFHAKTNILFDGTSAVAIFDDVGNEKNASRRFKAWGNLAQQAISKNKGNGKDKTGNGNGNGNGNKNKNHAKDENKNSDDGADSKTTSIAAAGAWKAPQQGGIAVSANGMDWTDYKELQSPSNMSRNMWRFDAQASMFYDERRQQYVGTNRAFRPCNDCGDCPIWWQPSGGCQHHRGHFCSAAQCEQTVRAVGTVNSAGKDFMTTAWGANIEVSHNPSGPEQQYYSQVTWPFYNVYLGIVMIFDAVDPPDVYGKGKVHCELQYSTDPNMVTGWTRISPGNDFIPLGTVKGESKGDFDSHVCFASGNPLRTENGVKVFYMGGDGPHYSPAFPSPLHRNSSFGLATLRQDGFIAVRAKDGHKGTAKTIPLLVSGKGQLIATADTAFGGGAADGSSSTSGASSSSVSLSVNGKPCTPIAGTNVTDQALAGCGGLVVGTNVTVDIQLAGSAMLYTIGFI